MSAIRRRTGDRAVCAGRLGVRRRHRPPSGVDDRHRRADRAGAMGRRWGRVGASVLRFGPFGWDVRVRGRRGRAGTSDRLEIGPRGPIRSHGLRWTSSPLAQRRPRRRYGADIRLHGAVAAAVADGGDGGQGWAGARTLAAQGAGRGGSGHGAGDVMTSLEPSSRSAPGPQLAISSGRAGGTKTASASSRSTKTRVASGIASPARPGCTCTPLRRPGPPRTRSRAGRSRTSSP